LSRLFRFVVAVLALSVLTYAQGEHKPKNIILLIGDGMGLNAVAVSALKTTIEPFKKFTTVGLSITKSIDELITDSGAAATALATGYRTKNHFIGVDVNNKKLKNYFELAKEKEMSTGIVVTDNVAGATPSGFFAHHNSRYDMEVLTRQYLGSNIDVVIGGGTKYFTPLDTRHIEKLKSVTDELEEKGYKFYYDYQDLSESPVREKIFCLFGENNVPKAKERDYTLGELTSIAIRHLSTNKNGFVMMVEGSQIDWAGHDDDSEYLVSELNDFTTAIDTALAFAERDGNTLVLVTSDHETGGMAIINGSYDASDLDIGFVTDHHTAGFVGVFAKGPGEENFNGIYGNYMIGRKIFRLLDESYRFDSN
jgi:alkaline phosphatase